MESIQDIYNTRLRMLSVLDCQTDTGITKSNYNAAMFT